VNRQERRDALLIVAVVIALLGIWLYVNSPGVR
jgi:hypothetical protein